MQPVSHGLYEQLRDAASERPSVLELGCGSGALGVALLELGASRYDGIDLSPESLAAARRRADSAGVADRATFVLADGALSPLTAHDWVVMDRAICCYPDVDAMLSNAIPAATKRVAFSVPHSRGLRGWANRLVWGLLGVVDRIRNNSPGYIHSLDFIEGRLAAAGFRLLRNRPGLIWYSAVWER